jgi:hypothetical protein
MVTMAELFRIDLKEHCKSTSDPPGEPPEDDPGDVDMYLWRYCYDHNRRVVVQVGSMTLETKLDPDIRMMLLGLPQTIREIEAGEPDVVYFNEAGSEVAFTPEGDRMLCRVHLWGATADEPQFACDRAQVIGELWQFVEGLARQGVDQGYLTEQQAYEFLGHELPPNGSTGRPLKSS